MMTLSRGLVRSWIALVCWALLIAAAMNFVAGSVASAALFGFLLVVALVVVAQGSLIRRLMARPMQKANLLMVVVVIALVIVLEVVGVFSSRFSGSVFDWVQIVGVAGIVLLGLLMIWHSVRVIRPPSR
jgi:hypothetical protein